MRVVAVLLFVACALGANAMSRDAVMERELAAEELADAADAAAEADVDIAAAAAAETEADVDAEADAEVTGGNCMTTAGLNMIKSFEGFYPKQYKDVAGIPTIGYGTLCRDNLIRCPGPVTEPVAAQVLSRDLLKKYGPCVSSSVKAPLNNQQYSALVSFAYNAGCGALATVAKNNKLDKASGANYAAVPANMLKYNKARVNGVLQVVRGLTNRRNAEVALFRSTAVSACMPGAALRSGAPVLRATPITQYAECKALGGTCQTAACGGSIVRNKCGPGAPTCCVPKPATPVTPTPVTPTPVTPAPAPAGANCMSVAGLAMVKSFEGFYPNEYKDVAGIPTIGYGTLCRDNIIRCPGPVSEATAAAVLGAELVKKYSGCVRSAVKAPLNNNQFSALTSFAYNAGCGAASNVIKYAKLDQPNASLANYKVVPSRMALYNKARVKGVLQVVRGLVRRRAAEGALFVSTASAQCMAGAVLKSSAPVAAGAAAAAPAKKRRALNTAHSVFNLRAGEVDLPSGTQVTYGGVPNSTHKKIVAMADIAPDVHGHDNPRKNRGPVGRWSKRAQREAKDEPVQNLVISVQI